MSKLTSLLIMGHKVADTPLEAEDFLERLDEYADAFDEFFASSVTNREEKDISAAEVEELNRLKDQHAAVMEKAEAYRRKTEETLRKLKKQGKGIMAYAAGGMPSRLSTIRPRKG